MVDSYTLALYGVLLAVPVYVTYQLLIGSSKASSSTSRVIPAENTERPLKTVMQAPRTDLAPPKDDPFTPEQLREYDGSNPGKAIYVAIKGTIFDVSHKAEVYGPGKSYNVFAGKDGSKGLGMSSLKPEDAVADYSQLDEKDRKTLDDWYDFFSKRYNIVGRVVQPGDSA
ncbi:cytochrome b5 [Amanita muscaria]